MDGFLNVNKPSGITSHDVVSKIRLIVKEKKVGHLGTLDPDATGVLVLCIGKATKLAQFLRDLDKVYTGTMTLGITTDTLDAGGQVIKVTNCANLSYERIADVFNSFIGEIEQIPPMVSAVKVDGKRLYSLARRGKIVEREPRKVKIYKLDILRIYEDDVLRPAIEGKFIKIDFRVHCSKGTYVRSLASDIGNALQCGAHLSYLVRDKVGDFSINDAIDLKAIESDPNIIGQALRSMDDTMSFIPKLVLNEIDAKKFVNGLMIKLERGVGDSVGYESSGLVRVHDVNGRLLGIGKAQFKDKELVTCKPMKVLLGP